MTEFKKAKLDYEDHYLNGSTFTRVNLNDTVISDSQAVGIRFDDMNMTNTSVENVNLTNATFHDVNLAGAAIDDANLEGMTINGTLVTDLLAKWDAN